VIQASRSSGGNAAELVFQTPDQRITKRDEVQWGNSEVGMLPTRA
jgi:hypothetical protein